MLNADLILSERLKAISELLVANDAQLETIQNRVEALTKENAVLRDQVKDLVKANASLFMENERLEDMLECANYEIGSHNCQDNQ